jgi:transcriptional regulator with XRE-family HTH domain
MDNTAVLSNLANQVYRIRKSFKMSMGDFAKKCGLSSVVIQQIEKGKSPQVTTLLKIAKACDVNPSIFFLSLDKDQLEGKNIYLKASQWKYVFDKAKEQNMNETEWLSSLIESVRGKGNFTSSYKYVNSDNCLSCVEKDALLREMNTLLGVMNSILTGMVNSVVNDQVMVRYNVLKNKMEENNAR